MKKGEVDKDTRILTEFIRIFCDNRHNTLDGRSKQLIHFKNDRGDYLELCPECMDLLEYSIRKRELCSLNPKPMCRKCKIHCYSEEYRSRIREVMRFSGKHLIKHGRFDFPFFLKKGHLEWSIRVRILR
ncbi:MAG: nitrous oxide-stimulated promoter family protein [Candidatus Bathyarchaeota archaeon]|nr:nitrous oxide-stimulated promoter family protein [Candidatus Bathyarchaeota archaeon]